MYQAKAADKKFEGNETGINVCKLRKTKIASTRKMNDAVEMMSFHSAEEKGG